MAAPRANLARQSAERVRASSRLPQAAHPGPGVGPLEIRQALENPLDAAPQSLLALQRTVGNRAVRRLLAQHQIQAKLTVGPADDAYEREADRVAAQVMRAANSPPPPLQHEDEWEGGAIRRRPLAATITPLIQRHSLPPRRREPEEEKELEEEEEVGGPVQRRAVDVGERGFEADPRIEQALIGSRGGGRPLDSVVRRNVEECFGADFGGVRIHTDNRAAQLSRDLSAQAFTHGKDIYFGAGQYNPATSGGRRLLAHELTHVVQQTGADKLSPKKIRRVTPASKNGSAHIQRASKGQAIWNWVKRIFVGVPVGLVFGAIGALVGPILGAIKGYREAKDAGKGRWRRLGGIWGGMGGGFVGGIAAGLLGGQKLAVHEPEEGDIPWGAPLPSRSDMAEELVKGRQETEETQIKEHIESVIKDRVKELLVPTTALMMINNGKFMGEFQKEIQKEIQKKIQTAFAKEKGVIGDDVLAKEIQTAFAEVMRVVKDKLTGADNFYAALENAKKTLKDKKDKMVPFRVAIVNRFKNKLEEEVKGQAGSMPIPLPPSAFAFPEDIPYTGLDPKKGAETFLTKREEQYEMPHAYVPDDERPAFAEALKQMPTVQFILNPRLQGAQDRQVSEWKDGGTLHEESNIKPEDDLVKAKKWLSERRLKSRTFRKKLKKVDRLTRIVVGPDLLKRIKKPEIHIHSTASLSIDAPWGFRAYQDNNEVHVSYNESSDVIAHEVGHAIERHLPLERWHDVHMLLGARHAASGGGGAKAGAVPIFTTWTEGRYGGKYVTGKYTSRTYSFANFAEVVSMAMQYFANPSTAREIIEGDPQHAAIVLRSLRPDEYNSVEALRRFNKYIPHKKAPPVPPKPSPERQRHLKALNSHRNKPLPPLPVKRQV